MKKIIQFGKSIDFRIYLIIFFAGFLFLIFGVKFYNNVKTRLIEISDNNKMAIADNIVIAFNSWLNDRVNSLVVLSSIIENTNLLDDEKQLNSVIKTFFETSTNFAVVQILRNDGEIFINGKRFTDEEISPKSERLTLLWYLETMQNNSPTINYMPSHKTLKIPTLNICVPTRKDTKPVATLCGIIKFENIFDISNFKLPGNAYAFILANNGGILTKMDDEKIKKQIESQAIEMLLNKRITDGFMLDRSFVSFSRIAMLDWYIGVGANESKQIFDMLSFTKKNSFELLAAFILLTLFAHYSYNYLYKRAKRRNQEYKILLEHKTKIDEMGELISNMNHQFIQPVNSLNLMISSLLMLQKDKNLNDEILRKSLENGQNSVKLLKDTIDVFANFSTSAENIYEFSVTKSIKNLLIIMRTELNRANVNVVFDHFDDILISQKECIIQQILLILIHNAKDALLEKYPNDISKRQININVQKNENKCFLLVSEYGIGLNADVAKRIFKTPKTTKKTGNGIGLYFGKKLANEKINGDIELKNRANPTIFELSFDIKLKEING